MSVYTPQASGEVLLPSASPQPELSFVEHQVHRARFVRAMVGHIGVRTTARAVYDKLRTGNVETPIEITNPSVAHPLKLTTRPSDIWCYNEIFEEGVYDLPRDIDAKINGKTVIDLGANIGLTAALFASRYRKSKIISVEPHPRNFSLLQQNAQPYEGQIKPIHGAVAPKAGHIAMSVFGGSETNYVANRFSLSESSGTSDIPAITPSDILKTLGNDNVIGLLKIDIEGAEKELFESGAMDDLLQRTEHVVIETHERFVPGSAIAVSDSLAKSDFAPFSKNGHSDLYIKL